MATPLRTALGALIALSTVVPTLVIGSSLGRSETTAAPVTAVTAAPHPEGDHPDAVPVGEPAEGVETPEPTTSTAPSPKATVPTRPPAPPAPPKPSAPATPQRQKASRTATAGCTPNPGAIRPARFQISRMGVDVPMITVGKDKDGNPGASPLSQMYTAAWYKGSPAPGTTRGNVVVNIHSWASGPALGNDLRTKMRTGDVIRVVGTGGTVACYRFREAIKIKVATYDPSSGVYLNPTGKPQLAILTCWDRNPRTGVYESRILFYADPIR
ncbi:class F sortase [Mariniluteicoccus endophyticus]